MAAHCGACRIRTGASDRIDIGTAERFAASTHWAGRTFWTAEITGSGVLRRTTGETSAIRTLIAALGTVLGADLLRRVTIIAAPRPRCVIASSVAAFTADLRFVATLIAVCIAVR